MDTRVRSRVLEVVKLLQQLDVPATRAAAMDDSVSFLGRCCGK